VLFLAVVYPLTNVVKAAGFTGGYFVFLDTELTQLSEAKS
jgi:hypothetical protein